MSARAVTANRSTRADAWGDVAAQGAAARLATAAVLTLALLSGCSESPERLLARATAARDARDDVETERHLKALLRRTPDSLEARLMLATLHATRHDAPSAAKEWQRRWSSVRGPIVRCPAWSPHG
jgi:cytochrome c-type biogenesis protein CcmH/NrfG